MTNVIARSRSELDLDRLIERGWLEIPDYFDESATRVLLEEARRLERKELFRPAGIRSNKVVNENVRSDSIFWIDDWNLNAALSGVKSEIVNLGALLSQELRVSLKCFEGHFSHYGAGDFYLKHLDQHKEQRRRQITLVSYLNDCDGGELVIFDKDDRNHIERVVYPKAGKLVLFLSAFIFHEVKASKSDRYGLTGWYRDDSDFFGERVEL